MNTTIRSRRMPASALTALVCAFLFSTWCPQDAAADAETIARAGMGLLTAFTMDDAQITEMARRTVQAMDSQERAAPDGSPYAYRAAMLSAMFRSVNGKPLNFKVYMKDEVNALAVPDGSIRIYSGLMDQMTDDELIWVAGHEIGHVVRGHSLQQFKMTYSVRSARELMAMGDQSNILSSDLGGLFEQAINAQFSQQHEYEADDTGLTLTAAAGFDPMAAVSALEKIAALSGSGRNLVAQFISTHPAPEERARRLRMRISGGY